MKQGYRFIVAVLMAIFFVSILDATVQIVLPSGASTAYAQTVFRRGQQGTEDSEQQKREATEKKTSEAEEAKKAEDARKADEARRAEEAKRAEEARQREQREAAERERRAVEARQAEERRIEQAAERERRATEAQQKTRIERVEDRPPAVVTPSPSIQTPPVLRQPGSSMSDQAEHRPAAVPAERTGTKFERVQERTRPVLPQNYIPSYYPYDYEWYRYYHSFPSQRVIVVREEPQVIVIEKPATVSQPVQQPSPLEAEPEPTVPIIAEPAPPVEEMYEQTQPEPTQTEIIPQPLTYIFWPGSVERAYEEIGRGWLSADVDLIAKHVDPKEDVRIYRDGKLTHKLKGDEFIELTRDAIDRLQTTGFSLRILTRMEIKVFARGIHTYISEDGVSRQAEVNYTLKKIDENWTIVEAGFGQPEPESEG